MASTDVSARPGGAAPVGLASAAARHARTSRSSSLLWPRLWRNPRVAASSLVLLVIVAVAVFAPWLTPQDPMLMDSSARLQGPSAEHRLGTDEYGRDLLSRIILGSRTSIVVA